MFLFEGQTISYGVLIGILLSVFATVIILKEK